MGVFFGVQLKSCLLKYQICQGDATFIGMTLSQ